MNLIEQKVKIIHVSPVKYIDQAARVCYKSEGEKSLIPKLLKKGHTSPLEFMDMIVEITCDRGISHELVRHRLCSFCQESTRYVDYKKELTFIIPIWAENIPSGRYLIGDCPIDVTQAELLWFNSMLEVELVYKRLRQAGWSPQKARSVLPHSLTTRIYMKANMTEWRHIFKLRRGEDVHPQMKNLMEDLFQKAQKKIPEVFSDMI